MAYVPEHFSYTAQEKPANDVQIIASQKKKCHVPSSSESSSTDTHMSGPVHKPNQQNLTFTSFKNLQSKNLQALFE